MRSRFPADMAVAYARSSLVAARMRPAQMSGQQQSAPRITALGVVASPSAPSRASALVEAVLAAATAEGAADARVIVLGERVMAFADGTPAENQSGDTRAV